MTIPTHARIDDSSSSLKALAHATMVNAGQFDEVARYCESDVLNTYRVWLIYEHFRGTITTAQLEWSEMQIREFVRARKLANPHLNAAMGITSPTVLAPLNVPITPNAPDCQGR